MNKNALLAIAIVSLNSLCYGMFNSHMPATNQIAQQMHNQAIRNAEIQRQQQQELRTNQNFVHHYMNQGQHVPDSLLYKVDSYTANQARQHNQKLIQQRK